MTPDLVVRSLGSWHQTRDSDHDGETWIATRHRWEVYACRLDTGRPRWLWSIWDGDRYRADGESTDPEEAAAALAAAVERIPDRVWR